MTVIVAATGLAGFLASFFLLHAGPKIMWIRYLLAVGVIDLERGRISQRR
jgi:hypothetical protein